MLSLKVYLAASLCLSAASSLAQDLPVAPAPWTLNVEQGWVFAAPPLLSSAFLPAGFTDPKEEVVERSEGVMVPDLALMMIVRYSSSPVGPYDEMIYIPGKWAYKTGDAGFRITRIYVSTNESVVNGRRNWNIPKHVAKFDWQTSNLGVTTVNISSTESGGRPFFSAKFLPTTLTIPIEVNTSLTGDYLTLIQPPLPAGTAPSEIATDTWKSFLLTAQTKTIAANAIIGNLPGGRIGDGVGYPNIVPLAVGAKLNGILDFPVSKVLDL